VQYFYNKKKVMKLDLQEKLGNIDVKSVFSGFSPRKAAV